MFFFIVFFFKTQKKNCHEEPRGPTMAEAYQHPNKKTIFVLKTRALENLRESN